VRLRRQIDRSRLSPDGRINFDIFDHELEASIWLRENTQPYGAFTIASSSNTPPMHRATISSLMLRLILDYRSLSILDS